MEYKVGDWVLIKRTGQHCNGWEGNDRELKEAKILFLNYNICYNHSERTWIKQKEDGRRWNIFKDKEGNIISYTAHKVDYIVSLVTKREIDYEIY